LAQKSKSLEITALEIDDDAIKDAKTNFEQSKYANQIKLFHQSVQDFTKKTDHKFDLIVTNPPFYQKSLKSDKVNKNVAHHAESLTFDELIDCIDKLLSEDGSVWILLPPFEMSEFLAKAKDKRLFVSKKHKVKHNETKPVFREIVELKRSKMEIEKISTINIYENNQYSPIFVELLKDYYLIF
jgi:tRNA1Val (adenine37-N6)-methyltransferase